MGVLLPKAYFIDIETVPAYENLDDAPLWMQNVFTRKFAYKIKEDPEMTYERLWKETAALYAEFCKIVSISIGKIITDATSNVILRVKNLINRDEKSLLIEFNEMIKKAELLCAHNGKEFDFPILMRRMFINDIFIPSLLNCNGKKTWEYPLEDTLEMWSGSQWKYKASLDVIAQSLGFESPKKDMSGAGVADLYYLKGELPWEESDAMNKIKDYNNGDVVILAHVYLKLKQFGYKIDHVVYSTAQTA